MEKITGTDVINLDFGQLLSEIKYYISSYEPQKKTWFSCDPNLICSMLYEAYQKACIDRCSPLETNDELIHNLNEMAKWMCNVQQRTWIMLVGGCGSGKSTMLNAVGNVMQSIRQIVNQPYKQYNILMSDQEHAKGLMNIPTLGYITALELSNLAERDNNMFAELIDREWLMIDDIGTEPLSIKRFGTDCKPVVETLFHRYDKMQPTLITTNIRPDKIANLYGSRIADRMKEMCLIMFFDHPSYRK